MRVPICRRIIFITFSVFLVVGSADDLATSSSSKSSASSSLSSSSGNNDASTQAPASAVAAGLSCVDSDAKCALWASQGECQSNAVWMMSNCRRSCQSCQGGDRAWQLRNFLSKNYDNATASPVSIAQRVVRIESVRLTHMEMDENKQMVRAFGRMVMSWNDSKVSWDKDSWGISWLNFYWIQIWTPQLAQINAPNNSPGVISGKVLAANHTGQVYMWIDFNFLAPYNFVYDQFPNDEQRVCFKFDDKRFFTVRFTVADEVRLRRREAISDTHAAGWTISDMELSHSKYLVQVMGDWRQNPFDVQTNNCELCVRLRRNAAYYFAEMACPALAAATLTLSAVPLFHLGMGQLAMLALSIVVQLLALVTLNSRLPHFTATTPGIVRFAGFNLAATTLMFAATAVLRWLAAFGARSVIPLPRHVQVALALVDRWLPLAPPPPQSSSGTTGGDVAEKGTAAAASDGGGGVAALMNDSGETRRGVYAEAAHTVNRAIYALFALLYAFNILLYFVFM